MRFLIDRPVEVFDIVFTEAEEQVVFEVFDEPTFADRQ